MAQRLYIPSEMYDWPNHEHLKKQHHPCPRQLSRHIRSFPIPPPSRFPIAVGANLKVAHMQFQHMKMSPLVQTPLKTGNTSTAPARAVEDLHLKNLELVRIRHCSTALSRLAQHALAPCQEILNKDEYPNAAVVKRTLPGPVASSWSDDNTEKHLRSSLPSFTQQGRALDRLAAAYLTQCLRAPVAVNCEHAVQTQVYTQLIDIINT